MEEIKAMGLGAFLSRKQIQDLFLERHKVRTRSAQGQHWPGRPEAMVDFDSVLRNAILYHEIRFCMTRYGSVLRDTIL